MSFVTFMSSSAGRALRVVLGLALILIGLLAVGGTGGTVLAVVGALPLLTGILGICFLGMLFKPAQS